MVLAILDRYTYDIYSANLKTLTFHVLFKLLIFLKSKIKVPF